MSIFGGVVELRGVVMTGGYPADDGNAGSGGALRVTGRGQVTVANCEVVNNKVVNSCGGGVQVSGGSNVTITGSIIHRNKAKGWSSCGGGVSVDGLDSRTTITDGTVVANNEANYWGGGVYLDGTTIDRNEHYAMFPTLVVSGGALFANNSAHFGGGINVETANLHIAHARFDNNTAVHGHALFLTAVDLIHSSPLIDLSFINHDGSTATVNTVSPVRWVCAPGQYMPTTGFFKGSFTGCAKKCAAGFHSGNGTMHDTPHCAGACPPGHYCEEASVHPTQCPAGTFLRFSRAISRENCVACSVGSYSVTAASTACAACPVGKFVEVPGATRCGDCPRGGFCAVQGAASAMQTFEPCRIGTFNPTGGAWSNASCLACPRGKHNAIPGSSEATACTDCLPGSFADTAGSGVCTPCPAGTYQDSMGTTACKVCTRGFYCLAGATVPMPCPSGTSSNHLSATHASWCTAVPAGSWAPLGSTHPVACEMGKFNPLIGQTRAEACLPCPAHANTTRAASTDISQCECDATYYDAVHGPREGVRCVPCPVGTICSRGTTLLALELRPGFWRASQTSVDVRRCPDAARGCEASGQATCAQSLSTCVGGTGAAAGSGHATESQPLSLTSIVVYHAWMDGLCAPGLTGSFCRLCGANGSSAPFRYKLADEPRCADCHEDGLLTRNVGYAFLGVLLLFVLLFGVALLRRCMSRRLAASLVRLWSATKLANKLKITVGFYQIATKIDDVYEVFLPALVRRVLYEMRVIISLGLGSTNDMLACMGIRGFLNRLLFWNIMPIGLMGIIILGCTLRLAVGHRLSSRALLESALPLVIRLLFLLYPLVTNIAFEAFSCYEFENRTKAVLIADVEVHCSNDITGYVSEPHERIKLFAMLAMAYPFGLIAVAAMLLLYARTAIVKRKHTPLSRALSFLYREYETALYWWELVEMSRRVFLVGVMVLVQRGSISQIVMGAIFSATYLLWQVQAAPFANSGDDYLAGACSFALVIIFICCILFKITTLTELDELRTRMSEEQKHDFYVASDELSLVVLISVTSALVLSFGMFLVQVARERAQMAKEAKSSKARRLRYKESREEVEVAPVGGDHYHTFLSHVWGTGQDQMRIVKQRLLEMLPDLVVFLDVDDLEEIGDLEGYIERTQTVLIYCSDGYFRSQNCMRELVSSTVQQKPTIALLDMDMTRGGLTQQQVHQRLLLAEDSYERWDFDRDETPSGRELYEALFATEPIEWTRIGHFQARALRSARSSHGGIGPPRRTCHGPHCRSCDPMDVTMRLIAERVLPGASGLTYVDKELTSHRLKPLPPPSDGASFHVYISEHNLGAAALIEEVARVRGFRLQTSAYDKLKRLGQTRNVLYVAGDVQSLSADNLAPEGSARAASALTAATTATGDADAATRAAGEHNGDHDKRKSNDELHTTLKRVLFATGGRETRTSTGEHHDVERKSTEFPRFSACVSSVSALHSKGRFSRFSLNSALSRRRRLLAGSSVSKSIASCEHMLLYLTAQTWTSGDASAALAAEISEALRLGVHILLAHEMSGIGGQAARHGCEFNAFFSCVDGTTPPELLKQSIYAEIAVALKGGAWREASMALLGIALGLSKEEAEGAHTTDDLLSLGANQLAERSFKGASNLLSGVAERSIKGSSKRIWSGAVAASPAGSPHSHRAAVAKTKSASKLVALAAKTSCSSSSNGVHSRTAEVEAVPASMLRQTSVVRLEEVEVVSAEEGDVIGSTVVAKLRQSFSAEV